MKCDKKFMHLYAVTDRSWLGEQTLMEQVEQALQGGVTCLQLREKTLEQEGFLAEAMEMKAICNTYHVPLIINDNIAVAISSGASGVHVGQKDMGVAEVRAIIGAEMILGVSAQTREQALQAEAEGADYLGVGAVFATSTKLDADHLSHETVRSICASVSIPVVAIGGITAQNIGELEGLGLDGVAVVSAIFAAKNITQSTRQLYSLSEKLQTTRSDFT